MVNYQNLSLKKFKKVALNLANQSIGKDLVIGLTGDLGSGKTTFVREFAKAFKIKRIKSPTFLIVSVYRLQAGNFYHIDFYRTTRLKEVKALGINELLNNHNRVMLIEWVDKFPSIKQRCDLLINIDFAQGSKRHVQINKN